MNNEKVTFITATDTEVFGLTETGKFVYFDKQAASFVLKSNGAVLSMDKANILKKIEQVPGDYTHRGRYREPVVNSPKQAPSRIETMLTPVNISISLIGLGLLLWWFVS